MSDIKPGNVGKLFRDSQGDVHELVSYCEGPSATMENVVTKKRTSGGAYSPLLEEFKLDPKLYKVADYTSTFGVKLDGNLLLSNALDEALQERDAYRAEAEAADRYILRLINMSYGKCEVEMSGKEYGDLMFTKKIREKVMKNHGHKSNS